MSGITTTQSKIAEDLNAFANASWFTSTYLVRSKASVCSSSALSDSETDCNVEHESDSSALGSDLLSEKLYYGCFSPVCYWWSCNITS
jgi:hypothetical protein